MRRNAIIIALLAAALLALVGIGTLAGGHHEAHHWYQVLGYRAVIGVAVSVAAIVISRGLGAGLLWRSEDYDEH